MSDYTARGAPLTGRRVLAIGLGAFAIVTSANIALIVAATGTFPGLVVANSYVESQRFNDHIAAAREQAATGWTTALAPEGGSLILSLRDATGAPVRDLRIEAIARRPSDGRTEQTLIFAPGDESYRAEAALAPGLWAIEATATGAGPSRRIETRVMIPE